ncbi:MAG: DinB family protein, partial [candidate division Zixibacteria bacterium]|nr:DinB family protein [candidate division Zixibacteria bacterium]
PQVSLAIIRGVQERMAMLLEGLADDDWKRVGVHPERGEMTIDDLLEIYSRHGDKHVGHIMGLRAAKGW